MNSLGVLTTGAVSMLLLALALPPAIAHPSGIGIACVVRDSVAEITLEKMSDVTKLTVLRPDGGVVYIYSPRLGVDELSSPSDGTVEINPASQVGWQYADDGRIHSRLVFDDNGSYKVTLLGDAIDAKPPTVYARGTCSLDFISGKGFQRTKAQQEAGASTSGTHVHACVVQAPSLRPIGGGCRSTSGCGSQDCCRESGMPGSPCYCNTCCIAAQEGTATPLGTPR